MGGIELGLGASRSRFRKVTFKKRNLKSRKLAYSFGSALLHYDRYIRANENDDTIPEDCKVLAERHNSYQIFAWVARNKNSTRFAEDFVE